MVRAERKGAPCRGNFPRIGESGKQFNAVRPIVARAASGLIILPEERAERVIERRPHFTKRPLE